MDDFCPSSDDSEIKYKTQINLRIFSFTLRFKGWSSNPPTVIVNNVDDNYGIKYMLELATLKTSESNSERDAKIIKRFLTNLGIEQIE